MWSTLSFDINFVFPILLLWQVKEEYFQLLSEQSLGGQPHWHTIKANISEDPRYKAIESNHRRKELFKEYQQQFEQVSVHEISCVIIEGFHLSVLV
jgi:hypothetical protein